MEKVADIEKFRAGKFVLPSSRKPRLSPYSSRARPPPHPPSPCTLTSLISSPTPPPPHPHSVEFLRPYPLPPPHSCVEDACSQIRRREGLLVRRCWCADQRKGESLERRGTLSTKSRVRPLMRTEIFIGHRNSGQVVGSVIRSH